MKNIRLSDFHFELPETHIPAYPLEKRDSSRLLFYNKGVIGHKKFHQLPELLPSGAFLVFNNTKVIPARLLLQRKTGARIEILLLEPSGGEDVQKAMLARECSFWNCLIGNLKKWKEGEILQLHVAGTVLDISLEERQPPKIKLSWKGNETLAELLEHAGSLPLPPYVKRSSREEDKVQYQTIFATEKGAVAAPTAGLHFTEEVLGNIREKGISSGFVTLHVGAGTFQPVKEDDPAAHPMHNEKIVVEKDFIEALLKQYSFVIPVGTTSMRTLESLYWFGCKLREKGPQQDFFIEKLEPYSLRPLEAGEALKEVLRYMEREQIFTLSGQTEILILPGYRFGVCKGLITNFHLPQTTLILLVAAFTGENWRKIYESALENNYRFLSFGDSSLLIP
jgi:S-adenosylmethionine:tRNA ribosyltransferase-isomerase